MLATRKSAVAGMPLWAGHLLKADEFGADGKITSSGKDEIRYDALTLISWLNVCNAPHRMNLERVMRDRALSRYGHGTREPAKARGSTQCGPHPSLQGAKPTWQSMRRFSFLKP